MSLLVGPSEALWGELLVREKNFANANKNTKKFLVATAGNPSGKGSSNNLINNNKLLEMLEKFKFSNKFNKTFFNNTKNLSSFLKYLA